MVQFANRKRNNQHEFAPAGAEGWQPVASAQRAATGSVSPIDCAPHGRREVTALLIFRAPLPGALFVFGCPSGRAARLPLATLPLRLWRRRMDQVVALET